MKERNSFIARSYFGSVFGLIISYPLCGFIIDSFGWEATFYTIGVITVLWSISWYFLVFDTPDSHPRISDEEREYINTALGDTFTKTNERQSVPWKDILTSVPFWGLVITDSGNCVGIMTLGSYGSLYLKKMLGVNIKTNGVLSGLPMLSRYVGGLFHGAVADHLLRRGWRVITIRRVFNSICMVGPAIFMFILAFPPPGSQCSVGMTISLLSVGMFFNGALSSGHFSSPSDLSPNYAGTMFGISNTLSGGVTAYSTAAIVGAYTSDNFTFSAWSVVFATASCIYIITNTFYCFMISGDIQSWNKK